MSDLNEKLAQEAAELINGGEWRDGKWYSEGHRGAWRRALKPAADRIEKLETNFQLQLEWYLSNKRVLDDRIEKLEAALKKIALDDPDCCMIADQMRETAEIALGLKND